MTDFLLILGLTVLSNVFVTMFILHVYTIGLTKELSKLNDDVWDALNSNVDFTMELHDEILKELNKIKN